MKFQEMRKMYATVRKSAQNDGAEALALENVARQLQWIAGQAALLAKQEDEFRNMAAEAVGHMACLLREGKDVELVKLRDGVLLLSGDA